MNNFLYFFRGKSEIRKFIWPSDIHLLIIGIVIVGMFLILNMKKENRKVELFFSITLILQQVTLYFWYIYSQYKPLTEGLPLFHCRVAILFCAFGLLLKKELLLKIGTYWGILTSTIALIIIGSDPFSFPHITQFSYVIGHIFLFWISLYTIYIKKLSMDLNDFFKTIKFTNCFYLIVGVININLNSNYAYVFASPIGLEKVLPALIHMIFIIIITNFVILFEYLLFSNIISNKLKEKVMIYISKE